MPNAIDTFYSRGHPLLFYAAAATWMRIFGDSLIAEHSFSLFISCLLIISVFEVCYKIFNKRVAIISILTLSVQVMFFVQASFVLPEIMVALLILLTLYFYSSEKYFYTFLSCSALMLTKESGIVLGFVLGTHAFFYLFNKKQSLKDRLSNFASIFFSGVVIFVFFLVQKKINGWYLFPEHVGMIQWNWTTFWEKFKYSISALFNNDFRFRFFQLLLLISFIVAVKDKKIKYAIAFLPGLFIYAIIKGGLQWLSLQILFVLLLLSLLFSCYQLTRLDYNTNVSKKKFIYLSVFFLIAYLCFSCVNFFSPRYLMSALVILIVLSAYYFDLLIDKLNDWVYYFSLLLILIIGIFGFKHDSGLGDINLGAYDGMIVQQRIVDYLEKNNFYDKVIVTRSFQDREHLEKPYTGFLHNKVFKNVNWAITSPTDILIFSNIEPDPVYKYIKNDTTYHLLYRTQKGQVWGEIYGK